MHTVTFNQIEKVIPSCWDDLSIEDLFGLFLMLQRRTPVHQVKTSMLIRTLGMQITQSPKGYAVGHLPGIEGDIGMEQVTQLSDCFDFLFTEPDDEGNCLLNPGITFNPLRNLIAEADTGRVLGNVTYGQFQYLTCALSAMPDTPEEAMTNILNILYQPGYLDCGTDASDRILEPLLNQMHGDRELRKQFFLTVVTWYVTGSFQVLSAQFPNVFSGTGNDSGETVFEGQLRLLDLLCDGDVTKREAVRSSNLWDVIHNLSMRIEKNEKQKQNQS